VVLCGQPELDSKLKDPQLRQLRQRIMVRCNMRSLSQQEIHTYINERLRRAGAVGAPIFTNEAIEAVARYSCGIPRVVNLLCEHALIGAFADQQKPVLAPTVQAVAEEFELDEIPALPATIPWTGEDRVMGERLRAVASVGRGVASAEDALDLPTRRKV
jgi:general secretion pathway protein A